MPRIELIDVPLFGPDDPYHFEYDNIPLKNIIRREVLINLAVDNLVQQMTDAIGTQGSVSNRLNQSINPDGSIKAAAVDAALHSIDEHTDSSNYVRMTRTEHNKLALIADTATDFSVQVQNDDQNNTVVTFNSGSLRFVPSPTVTWHVNGSQVSADMTFDPATAHKHYYDQVPVSVNQMNPDFIHYKVNSMSSPFISGSLRVYVNGVRLTGHASIYVPGALVNDPWTLLTYTGNPSLGTFHLSQALSDTDVITIDYDISLA